MASSLRPDRHGTTLVQRVYGRLNRRLFAWFLLFSLVPLLVTNAVGYRRSATIITELVERFVSTYARLEAHHIGDRLQGQLKTLSSLVSGNGVFLTAMRDANALPITTAMHLQQYLVQERQKMRVFDALALFSVQGTLLASSDSSRSWGAPPAAEVRAAFAEFVQGTDDDIGPLSLRFVVPIFSPDTLPVGYLVASVGRASIATFLQLPDYEAGRIEVVIVDAENRPLASWVRPVVIDEHSAAMDPAGTLLSGNVTRYFDGRGHQRIAAAAQIPQSTWKLIAEVSADDALQPLRQLGGFSLLFELLLAALLLGVAALVAREIVAPVRRLALAARRVAEGDLTVRIPVRGYDEIAELGHAFNGMTRELTEATARIAELHQREIERASQLAAVGELASGLAHEIKNPVIGVTNGLDLVRRRVGEDPALTPILNEMTRQLARIGSTVHDLLAFARPATPQLGPVNANDAVNRAILLIHPAAVQAGVRIEAIPDAGSPLLQVDQGMLHQALVNLLMNALQATPSGGVIRARVHCEGDVVAIDVEDTGPGISSVDLAHVFRPFFTTRHKGTGLGLSITRGIIERHQGTVTIESTEGVGTTVHLRLPLRASQSAATEQERA